MKIKDSRGPWTCVLIVTSGCNIFLFVVLSKFRNKKKEKFMFGKVCQSVKRNWILRSDSRLLITHLSLGRLIRMRAICFPCLLYLVLPTVQLGRKAQIFNHLKPSSRNWWVWGWAWMAWFGRWPCVWTLQGVANQERTKNNCFLHKVVVKNMDKYGTCSSYCSSMKRKCKGGWEEVDTWLGYDTCEEELELGCQHDFADPTSTRFSTDAICECGGM